MTTATDQSPSTGGDRRTDRINARTRARLRSYLNSKDDWNLSRSLKNLIEQAVGDYDHRALIELLQNAHDAHDAHDRSGRILVRVEHDEGEHGVVYVANSGHGFTDSNFDAISDIAQSDKKPEEGIGNKGIGFKSVLQLSKTPEIYSTEHGKPGYCFRFAELQDLIDQLAQLGYAEGIKQMAAEVQHDVFNLVLPIATRGRPETVDALLGDGFVTVIRLPLKGEEALADALAQTRELQQDPPALLFLRRINEFIIEDVREGQTNVTRLRRSEEPVAHLNGVSVCIADLGPAGSYLVADKTVAARTVSDAIERSIAGDKISEGWRDWQGDATVSIAVPLDVELEAGRLYTHLPMGPDANAPLPAHVNAPFFAKLARVNLEESVPLNDMLLNEVADLCAQLLLAVPTHDLSVPAGTIVDLLSWTSPGHTRLQAAFAALDAAPATAAVVPLVAGPESWGCLATSFAWDDVNLGVLTAERLANHAGVPVIINGLSKTRIKRLDDSAQLFAGRRLSPTETDIAGWAERIAQTLASAPFDADAWGNFYDELAHLVRDREALQARRILIDDDGRLRACNSRQSDGRSAVAFFSPKSESDDTTQGDDLKPPSRLRRRVFYVNTKIPWQRRIGDVAAKRPGRKMLEDGLVNEYRASELLPVIAHALERRPALAADVLMWTYRFTISREDPPWHDIRSMRLLVPTAEGEWILATQAHLSNDWGGDDVTLLDELLSRAGGISADLADVQRRLITAPGAPPFAGQNTQQLREFLVGIGVRAGLWPDPVPRSVLRAHGNVFEGARPPVPPALPDATAAIWRAALALQRPTGLRPYTTYLSRTPLYRLAGQDDHANLPSAARLIYARLIAHGLAAWPEDMLTVTLRRYNDSTDTFTLPTPVRAFLTHADWVPIAPPGDRSRHSYVKPDEAWSHLDDAPPFAAVVASQVRRQLHANPASQTRARQYGVRNWDDASTAPERVRLLATLLEAGEVPATVLAQFRSAYEDAWITAVVNTPTGTPLDDDPRAPIVVSRGSGLSIVDLSGTTEDEVVVYVQDGDGRQTLHLLEHCALPVLRLRHSQAVKVAKRLSNSFPTRIRRVSEVTPTVLVDGSKFTVSADSPSVINNDTEWLVDVVAAVLELRAGRFRPRGADVLRRAITRLRLMRVVTAERIDASIDGHPVGADAGPIRWLTVSDDYNPTVLVQQQPGDDAQLLLERACLPIAELLGYSELGDALRVALIDLARAGYGASHAPDAPALAEALGEPLARIEEIRLAVRRPEEMVLDVLIPLVAVFDIGYARQLDAGEDGAHTAAAIADWICARADAIVQPSELLTSCSEGLDPARRHLAIALRDLNDAIRNLASSHRELKDPDAIAQQFRHAVSTQTRSILDSLRTAYLPVYAAGEPLDTYLENRDLHTLAADPAWPDEYYPSVPDEVIFEHINRWLSALGAPKLGDARPLEPVDTLRAANRARILEWARTSRSIVRAYAHDHAVDPTGLPGEPAAVADEAARVGLLDFEPLTLERFLAWLVATNKWPRGMPATHDLAQLGLPSVALTKAQREEDEARRRREDSRRRVTIDGKSMLADEANYAQIAEAIRAGIDDEFRRSSGESSLLDAGPQRRRAPSGGRPGTTAARMPRPSDIQTGAIGLAGEVAALEWLKAQYPGVTDGSAWRSGYRNQLIGDGEGDDTLGYDLVVDDHRLRLMFEVKATTGDQAEFLLTDAEIARAQNLVKRERYEILFVTHVFDSDMRQIHRLPNPLDRRYSQLYRTVGDGIRYRFELADAD